MSFGSKTPEAPPAPPPPARESDIAVKTARRDVAKSSAQRKGRKSSIIAGQTGQVSEQSLLRKTLGGI